jgi:DNA adenine methylase
LTSQITSEVQPFLRWAGGKRRILPELLSRAPYEFSAYVEPFLGAGALLFSQNRDVPKQVNDLNSYLVETYIVVRDHLDLLLDKLKDHQNDRDYYYALRFEDRQANFFLDSSIEAKVHRASRFIYLNSTCFNGLYRVNSRGEFNVPFGNLSKPTYLKSETLTLVSKFLNHRNETGNFSCEFSSTDFADCITNAPAGSFIYLDPPYEAISQTSSFSAYHQSGFTMADQERVLKTASLREDCYVLISNAAADPLLDLVKGFPNFKIEYLNVKRSISAKSSSRAHAQEILLSNKAISEINLSS